MTPGQTQHRPLSLPATATWCPPRQCCCVPSGADLSSTGFYNTPGSWHLSMGLTLWQEHPSCWKPGSSLLCHTGQWASSGMTLKAPNTTKLGFHAFFVCFSATYLSIVLNYKAGTAELRMAGKKGGCRAVVSTCQHTHTWTGHCFPFLSLLRPLLPEPHLHSSPDSHTGFLHHTRRFPPQGLCTSVQYGCHWPYCGY